MVIFRVHYMYLYLKIFHKAFNLTFYRYKRNITKLTTQTHENINKQRHDWTKDKLVRVWPETHRLMLKFCSKDVTYAQFVDELVRYKYGKELNNKTT